MFNKKGALKIASFINNRITIQAQSLLEIAVDLVGAEPRDIFYIIDDQGIYINKDELDAIVTYAMALDPAYIADDADEAIRS